MYNSYKLNSLADIIVWYCFRWSVQPDKNWNVFVFSAKDIDSNPNQKDLIKTSVPSIRSSAFIKPWDVIISSKWVFKSCVIGQYWDDVLASSTVYILRVKSNKILSEYLSIYFNTTLWQRKINWITSWTSIKTIIKKDLEELHIILPSIENQQKVIDIYNNKVFQEKLLLKKIELTNTIAEWAINYILTN